MKECKSYDELDQTCKDCRINNMFDHNSCYRPKIEGVEHPNHYQNNGRLECIEEMRILFGTEAVITFCKLNAHKYYYRAGNKKGESEEKDKEKAMWYMKKVAELMKDEQKKI